MNPKQITEYAKKHGVEMKIENHGRCYAIDTWAPKGMIWKSSGTHFIAIDGDGYYTKPDWKETMEDLKQNIEYGFSKCEDPGCDVCHPVEE